MGGGTIPQNNNLFWGKKRGTKNLVANFPIEDGRFCPGRNGGLSSPNEIWRQLSRWSA